jgi:hypothetical protein
MQKISTGHSGMHCFFLPLLEHTLCRDTRVHEDIQQLQLYCLRSNAIQKCIIATSNVCCMLTIILRSTHLYPPKVPKAKRHCYAECNNLQSITLRAQYRSVQHNNTLPSPCTYSQSPSKQTLPKLPQKQHPYPHPTLQPHQAYPAAAHLSDSASASSPPRMSCYFHSDSACPHWASQPPAT